ncbi:hypothetical protein E4U53_004664, partial [Claviceps sorghi]
CQRNCRRPVQFSSSAWAPRQPAALFAREKPPEASAGFCRPNTIESRFRHPHPHPHRRRRHTSGEPAG